MIQFAAVASVLPELVGILSDVVKSPETYKKLEGVRTLLCELTGKEIDKNGLVALLEGVTQGEPYTGEWETVSPYTETTQNGHTTSQPATRRLRVDGGWIYDCGRGNMIPIMDK